MPKKILLIEDDPQTLAICHSYLESSGYDVVTAVDGPQGLATARREKPDLIVLDLILPEMDGLEVCRAIRLKSQVPIIILSGRDEEMDKVIGLEIAAFFGTGLDVFIGEALVGMIGLFVLWRRWQATKCLQIERLVAAELR